MDDIALATALAKKDDDAARVLFGLYFDALYRFLRHLTRHPEDAEDLAQQTIIRILRNADRYDGRAPFRSWIYAIAYREYGRWRRRRLWVPIPGDLLGRHDMVDRTTDATLLLGALSKLSPAHRAAFLLHYVEGLSIEEIAVAQRAPAGTVKSRLHFARSHLRGLLDQEEFYVTHPSEI